MQRVHFQIIGNSIIEAESALQYTSKIIVEAARAFGRLLVLSPANDHSGQLRRITRRIWL